MMADHEIHLTVVGPDYEWDWSCDAGMDAARAAAALCSFAGLIGASIVGAWPMKNVEDQIARIGRDFPEFPAPVLTDLTGVEVEPLQITSVSFSDPAPIGSIDLTPAPSSETTSPPAPLTDESGEGIEIETKEI
jgi:hypothetical protein